MALSAHFDSLNRDFKLNWDVLMWNLILVTIFCSLNQDFTLNQHSLNQDCTVFNYTGWYYLILIAVLINRCLLYIRRAGGGASCSLLLHFSTQSVVMNWTELLFTCCGVTFIWRKAFFLWRWEKLLSHPWCFQGPLWPALHYWERAF